MLSRCLDQILTQPQTKSRLTRAIFLLSSFGGPLLTAASVSCCYLTGVVRSSASRFNMLCNRYQRCTSAKLCCNELLFMFLSNQNSLVILLWPEHFYPRTATIFYFLDHYLWRDGCVGKIPPRNAQTNNNATFNITSLPLFLHSEDHFELRQVILTMSTCLNELICCHVIGWLNILLTRSWAGEPNDAVG